MDTDLKEVKLRFFDMAIGDILRAIRGQSLMGAFTLSMCAIDAMAYLRHAVPGNRNRENFERWVADWMVPLNGRCLPSILYALRCGLVHTYGYANAMQKCSLVGFRYVHNKPSQHWAEPSPGYYVLNLDSHVAEVCIAASRFFDDVILQAQKDAAFGAEAGARAQNLISVQIYEVVALQPGRRQAIVRSQRAHRHFGEMDPALAPLDGDAEPSVDKIAARIRSTY